MGRLSENERQAELFKRSFAGLCKFGRYPHHFGYFSDDKDVSVRLLMEFDPVEPHMALVFPRSEKMKPYYPAIRKWFDKNGLEWKDRYRDKQKYMFAYVNKAPVTLEKTVRSIGENVFNSKELKLDSSGAPSIYSRIAVSRHLFKYTLASAIGVFNTIGFAIYELFQIFKLTTPSVRNLDVIEVRLFGLMIICMALTRLLQVRPRLHRVNFASTRIKWAAFAIVFGPPVAMFVTG